MDTLNASRLTRWARVAALATFPVALCGCGAAGPVGADATPNAAPRDPAWVTHRTELPPPDADRLNYDDRTRTLALYELTGNDRWMVQMPGEDGRPAVPQQRLPADTDLSQVMVYYARPGMKPSAPVSVQEIRACGQAHSSLAFR